jgi:hypothetical protein
MFNNLISNRETNMKFSATMKLNSNEKDKKAILEKMTHGWDSHVKLPQFHTLPFEGNVGIEYIFLNGTSEYIIIPSDKLRTVKTSMRIANPGIVIENGTLDNEQLRLPWTAMIGSKVVGRNICIKLDKNQKMKFSGFPLFRSEKHSLNFISKVINDYIESSRS